MTDDDELELEADLEDDDGDVFGDAEPEDSWDPDDPIPELVANLLRRRRRDHAVRDRELELEDVRARMFDTDLAHVLERLSALLERFAPMIVAELEDEDGR